MGQHHTASMSPRAHLETAAVKSTGTQPSQTRTFWPPGQSRLVDDLHRSGVFSDLAVPISSNPPRAEMLQNEVLRTPSLNQKEGQAQERWANYQRRDMGGSPYAASSFIIFLAQFKKQHFWSPVMSRRFSSQQEKIFMYLENSHPVTKCYEITIDSTFPFFQRGSSSILTYILFNLQTTPGRYGKKGIKYIGTCNTQGL